MEALKGRPCLVTGGLGFIGSNLVIRLARMGARVTVLDCEYPETGANGFNIEPVRDQVHLHRGDQRDAATIERLISDQDFIFNLVGLVSHVDSLLRPLEDLDVNCRAQLTLLEAVRNAGSTARILFTGTRGQYGAVPDRPVDETHPMRPTDVNGIDKVAGEGYHLLYHRLYGIRATSLRLSNTYGPRHQMRHSRQGVVNWFLRQIIDGETVRLFGGGEQKRDLTYVDDLVEALLLCAVTDSTIGQAYNVGGESFSLREIVDTMIRLAGTGQIEVVSFPADLRKIEIGSYTADTSKIFSATGWRAHVGLEEGLRRSIAYYRENRQHYWQ